MNSIFSRNACLLACVLSAAIWLLALTTAQDSISTSTNDLVVPPSESVTTLHGPADVDDAGGEVFEGVLACRFHGCVPAQVLY
jgi:hypothetical protein